MRLTSTTGRAIRRLYHGSKYADYSHYYLRGMRMVMLRIPSSTSCVITTLTHTPAPTPTTAFTVDPDGTNKNSLNQPDEILTEMTNALA
jgi:hypothetical protein